MKVIQKRSKVKTNAVQKQFHICTDATMFALLTKNLYSNPVKACIRELSANAVDAHTEAGQTLPFDIHLPYDNDPVFWIRDYGKGLSPEEIDDVYTGLGGSSRRESNDFIGCKGIGCATPFAVSDIFQVDSYYNGKQYTYSMYLNEESMPVYSLLLEKETTEHSGLKVTININSSSYILWTQAATSVFQYFDKLPHFIGYNPQIKKVEYGLTGNGWALHKGGSNGIPLINGGPTAIMGQIAYQLNAAALGIYSQPTHIRQIFYLNPDLFFDIGELSVTPSREALEYNNRTKAKIIARLNELNKELEKTINEQLNNCTNKWDARLFVANLPHKIKEIHNHKYLYKGEEITDTIVLDNLVIKDICSPTRTKPTNKILLSSIARGKHIYVNDIKGGISRACRNGYGYICEPDQLDELARQCDFDKSIVKKCSDLPKITHNRKAKTYKISKFKYGHHIWEEKDVDITKGGLYVCTYRYSAVYNDKKINNSLIGEMLIFLYGNVKARNIELIGCKKAYEKEFLAQGNWINLVDEVKKKLSTIGSMTIFRNGRPQDLIHKSFLPFLKGTKLKELYDLAIDSIQDHLQCQAIRRIQVALEEEIVKIKDITNDFHIELGKFTPISISASCNPKLAEVYINTIKEILKEKK